MPATTTPGNSRRNSSIDSRNSPGRRPAATGRTPGGCRPYSGKRKTDASPPPSAWANPRGDLEFVSNADLAITDLPPQNSDYERLWPFCLTYDGYHGGLWGSEDLAYVHRAVFAGPLGNASTDALRAAAYYAQRYIKHNSEMLYADPPSETLQRLLGDIRAVVEELRTRLR